MGRHPSVRDRHSTVHQFPQGSNVAARGSKSVRFRVFRNGSGGTPSGNVGPLENPVKPGVKKAVSPPSGRTPALTGRGIDCRRIIGAPHFRRLADGGLSIAASARLTASSIAASIQPDAVCRSRRASCSTARRRAFVVLMLKASVRFSVVTCVRFLQKFGHKKAARSPVSREGAALVFDELASTVEQLGALTRRDVAAGLVRNAKKDGPASAGERRCQSPARAKSRAQPPRPDRPR